VVPARERDDSDGLLLAFIVLMAVGNVVGALYLTIEAESSWLWIALIAGAVALCFATRRLVIGRALGMIAVVSALAYGMVGFFVLVASLVG
jgi:hypothetical protein